MIDILRDHILKRLGNDADNLEVVLAKFKPIVTKRHEQLLTQGESCKYVYFIARAVCKYMFMTAK